MSLIPWCRSVTRTAVEDAALFPAAVNSLEMFKIFALHIIDYTDGSCLCRLSSARRWRTLRCFLLLWAAWKCMALARRWAIRLRSAQPRRCWRQPEQVKPRVHALGLAWRYVCRGMCRIQSSTSLVQRLLRRLVLVEHDMSQAVQSLSRVRLHQLRRGCCAMLTPV